VRWEDQIGGVAVRDGLVVVSLPTNNKLHCVASENTKILGEVTVDSRTDWRSIRRAGSWC